MMMIDPNAVLFLCLANESARAEGVRAGRAWAELDQEFKDAAEGDLAARIAKHLRRELPPAPPEVTTLDYLTVEEAARRMHLSANALRLRIRRRTRRDGKKVSAHLGAGIMALQIGRRSWRVQFPT